MLVNKKTKIIICLIAILFGILIIIMSTKLGDNDTTKELVIRGGMDEVTHMAYLSISMIKYVCIGFLISLIGGLGLIKMF